MLNRTNGMNMGIAAIAFLTVLALVLSLLFGFDPPMALSLR